LLFVCDTLHCIVRDVHYIATSNTGCVEQTRFMALDAGQPRGGTKTINGQDLSPSLITPLITVTQITLDL